MLTIGLNGFIRELAIIIKVKDAYFSSDRSTLLSGLLRNIAYAQPLPGDDPTQTKCQ